jgi:hypothetical protein
MYIFMMNWAVTFYAAILFFVLTPSILVRLPPNGSKFTVAAFHALVFALVFHFTHKMVWQMSMGMGMPNVPMRKEGMDGLSEEDKKKAAAAMSAMSGPM